MKTQETPVPRTGYNAMGKPISFTTRQEGFDHCIQMGLTSEIAFKVVNMVAEQLARDKPFEAMEMAKPYLDLTGTYVLMAVLLTPKNP